MKTFDSEFFNELVKIDALVKVDEYTSALMPPRDRFRLRVSEMHAAGKISDAFIRLTQDFIATLDKRSGGRYTFEKDFRAHPYHIFSYSKGRSGRKQLYVGFDAHQPSALFPCHWGASIGLHFDFRNEHGVITECVNEYEAFYEKVFADPELFDATFGSLGGYDGSTASLRASVTAESVCQTPPNMMQHWLFYGRRLTPDDITAMGSLDAFVDECIRVFDVISEAGYFQAEERMTQQNRGVIPSLLFENFVVGKENELAHTIALEFFDSPNKKRNPLFIYGGVGLGKTHLLHAIGNRFMKENSQANVCYVHATNFVSEVIRAFKTKQFDEFKQLYRSLDLLLIDDIQTMSDKPGTQQEFLYILNFLTETKQQVVITGNVSQNELQGVEPHLLSRFGGSLTVSIEAPALEMRVAFLLQKFNISNNPIGEDVACFIAEHVTSSFRELEGAHNRVEAFARFHKRPITVKLVKEALKDLFVSNHVNNIHKNVDLLTVHAYDNFTDMSKIIPDLVKRISQKKGNSKAITGIATCFPSLDYYTSGLQRGSLIVVAGRPSMGKRNFVRNIAMKLALVNELPVSFLENESSCVMLATRIISSMTKVGFLDLCQGQVGHGDFERIESAADTLKNAPIYFSSLTPVSVQELGEQLRRLNQRAGGLGLAVVDCLPELKLSGEKINDDYAIKIAHTSRYLKELAKELDISIVVLSPINRDIEERANKWPVLTDLPGMAAIANAADLVLMVYRDEVYEPETEEKGTAQIIVARNREGFIGVFSLKFDGRYGNFEEINNV